MGAYPARLALLQERCQRAARARAAAAGRDSTRYYGRHGRFVAAAPSGRTAVGRGPRRNRPRLPATGRGCHNCGTQRVWLRDEDGVLGTREPNALAEQEEDEARWSQYMAAAHRGDAHAYERLLNEVSRAIERYVRRRFGALVFIEDCVQECLLAIHTGRHTYDPRRPFRPWLFAIVRHKTIDMLRRAYVPQSPSAGAIREPVEAHADDPADELAAGELLRQLPPGHRDALELTKIIGYSTSEAAARLGISETALRTRVSRAVRATLHALNRERL